MKRIISVLLLICLVCSCCFVSVSAKADSVKLAETNVVLTVGEKYKQKLADGKKIVNKDAEWVSSDEAIATINSNGVVKAKAPGEAVLKAIYKNKTYKFSVVVKKLRFIEKKLVLRRGQKFNQVLKGANGAINAKNVAWGVEDTKVATISKNGVVKGKKPGSTVAYAKYKGQKVSFKIITVEQKQKECANNYNLLKNHIVDYGRKMKNGDKFIYDYDFGKSCDYDYTIIYNAKADKLEFLFETFSYEYESVDRSLSFSIDENSYSAKIKVQSVYGYGRDVLGESNGASKIYINKVNKSTKLNYKFDEESTTWLTKDEDFNKILSKSLECFNVLVFYETGLTLNDIGFVSCECEINY